MLKVLINLQLYLVLSLVMPSSAFCQTKTTVGWIENVKILPYGIVVHAKLDTGADESSLFARDIQEYSKNGKKFVKFYIRNRYGKSQLVDLEVVRSIHIKKGNGKSDERKVVRLTLCIANKKAEVNVNLADRRNFSIPMLIGRGFSSGNLLIDPSSTYTKEPEC